jgi:hypothetical protein
VYFPGNQTFWCFLTLGANMVLTGVEYDSPNGYFIMVGGNIATQNGAVFYYWDSWNPPFSAAMNPALFFVDYVWIGEEESIIIAKDRPIKAFYSGVYTFTDLICDFPLISPARLNGGMMDNNNYLVWIFGQDASGNALYYYFLSGGSGVYKSGPTTAETPMMAGKYNFNLNYGIVGGASRIMKISDTVSSPDWYQGQPREPQSPTARDKMSMVWISSQSCFMMFGGATTNAPGRLGDVWLYYPYLNKWVDKTGAYTPQPSARFGYGMAYDSTRDRVVLYGGYDTGYRYDTWEFNPTRINYADPWILRDNTTGTTRPGPLASTRMVFSNYDNRIYLYGGTGGGTSNDFYTWDGFAWAKKTHLGVAPSLMAHGMAYEPVGGRIYIYGGSVAGTEDKTYEYSIAANSMAQLIVTGVPTVPGYATDFPTLTWSPRYYQQLVLYGGKNSVGGWNSDVWIFSVITRVWTKQTMPTGTPLPRSGQAGAAIGTTTLYNTDIVYFGGSTTGSTLTNQTFVYGQKLTVTASTIYTETGITWRGVGWYSDDSECIIAGSSGKLRRHTSGTTVTAPIESSINPTSTYRTVLTKTPASPGWAWVLGTAGGGAKINDISGSSPITINALGPGVSYADVTTWSNVNMLNTQIDVDAGGSSTLYQFKVRTGHSSGPTWLTTVDVYLWYDNGLTLSDQPAILGASFDNVGFENTRMHFRWYQANNTFMRVYPKTLSPNEETTLQVGSCTRVNELDGQNVTLSFAFSPHQQVRATGSAFVEPAGTRYDRAPIGWNFGDQSTINALNSANTWDFKVLTTAGASTAVAYDEFGFFKYTHLSSAGLPGSLTGSGAPGSLVSLSPSGFITFEANCPYKLVAYVDSNLIGQNLGQTIFATNMRVQGGDLTARYFNGTGSANALYAMGSPTTYRTPASQGKTTSTSIGTMGAMQWYCYLPSVPQDTYTTTITYLLQN